MLNGEDYAVYKQSNQQNARSGCERERQFKDLEIT